MRPRLPRIVRLIERKSIAEAASVEDLVRARYDAGCVKANKGRTDILRTFEIQVIPVLGELVADCVKLPQWMDLLEAQARCGLMQMSERIDHLRTLWSGGLAGYAVVATAKDTKAQPRKIQSCEAENVRALVSWEQPIKLSLRMPLGIIFHNCLVSQVRES